MRVSFRYEEHFEGLKYIRRYVLPRNVSESNIYLFWSFFNFRISFK